MALTVHNAYQLPSSAIPVMLTSGTVLDGHAKVGIVQFQVASSTGGNIAAATFGLKTIYSSVILDASGTILASSATYVTTGNTDGTGFAIAVGEPL